MTNRIVKTVLASSVALLALAASGISQAATVTLDNSPATGSISAFGTPDSQTYGEVFTAPVTGTLTSFTLSLNDGVGALYGGVSSWNGPSTWAYGYGSGGNLFTSTTVASNAASSYSFSPNASVTQGQQYVVYLSVNSGTGADSIPGANNTTSMPTTDATVAGLDYFVWDNSTDGSGPQNSSWNYFGNFGNALTQLSFDSSPSATPLPGSLPLFGAAVAALGLVAARRRRSLSAV